MTCSSRHAGLVGYAILMVWLGGCGDLPGGSRAEPADATAGGADAGARDGGVADGGGTDGGVTDGSVTDGGVTDGGVTDGGVRDSAGGADAFTVADASTGRDAAPPADAHVGADACVPQTAHRDADGDGYGNPAVTTPLCAPTAGWVGNALDCADGDGAIHPGAPLRPGTDSNCDGHVDHDVNGDGVSDLAPGGVFDPMVQRHIQLADVAANVPFEVVVHAGEADPQGILLPLTSGFAEVLTWNAAQRSLAGTVRDPGVYTFHISVCRVVPYDADACAQTNNRRVDLAHLTVHGPLPPQPAPPVGVTGPYRAAFRQVMLDVTGVLRDFDVEFLPQLAEGETDPVRREELLGLGTQSPTRVIYPALAESDDVAPGQFPLVVVLHGNGYHWDDYDELGGQLASHGAVVVIPQFVNGFVGACGGGPSVQQRVLFGQRAMQWALAESSTSGLPLSGHLDSARVVVVGHSWGGAAAEWSMPVWGARAFVVLDPISLLHNTREWVNCNTDLVTPSTTRNHLRPTWRDIALPVLLLDSGRSSFVATQAEFRGLYPHGPTVHVSTQDTQHEDFLDPEDGVLWFDENTCFDPVLGQAHRRLAALWMVRFLERHVNGNLAFDDVVHGKPSLATEPADYPRKVFTATYQPSMRTRLLDQAANAPMDEPRETPRANLAGGTTVATGSNPRVGLAPATQAVARPNADGGYDVFGQATVDFMRSNDQPAFRQVVTEQDTTPVQWSQAFAQPLDATGFRFMAWEMSATGLAPSACTLNPPSDPVDALDVTLTLTSQDGRTVQQNGAALQPANAFYRGVPITLMMDLREVAAGVDLSRITGVHVEVPPAGRARVLAFDNLRLVP